MKIALKRDAIVFSFVPFVLLFFFCPEEQLYLHAFSKIPITASVKEKLDPDLHFPAAGAPLKTQCQLISQQ